MSFSDFICTFAMSEILLILVLHLIINETQKDLAKVQIKSEKLTPFGGFFRFASSFQKASISLMLLLYPQGCTDIIIPLHPLST